MTKVSITQETKQSPIKSNTIHSTPKNIHVNSVHQLPQTNQLKNHSNKSHAEIINAFISSLTSEIESSELGKLREIVNSNHRLSLKELLRVYRSFKKLAHQMKSNQDKEISLIASRYFKYIWHQKAIEQKKERVLKKLSPFGQPGGGMSKSANIGLSGNLGLTIPTLNTRLGPSLNFGLSADRTVGYTSDDEAFFYDYQTRTFSGNASLNLSAQVKNDLGADINIAGQVKHTLETGREYADVQDYVLNKNFVTIGRRSQCEKTRISWLFKRKLTQKDFLNTHQSAYNAQIKLNQYLEKNPNIKAAFSGIKKVQIPDRSLGSYYTLNVYSSNISTGASISAKIGAGPISINQGAGVKAQQNVQFVKTIGTAPYNPIEILKKQANNQGINKKLFIVPIKWYEAWCTEINQKNPVQLFNELKSQTEAYYNAVHQYDFYKKNSYSSKHSKKQYAQNKHQIEKEFNVIGRHQYLHKTWMKLACIYTEMHNQGLLLDENLKDKVDNFITLLDQPNFHYNREIIEDKVYGKYNVPLSILDFKTDFEVSLSQFKGRVEITHRTRNHPSLIRDGHYIDVVITGEVSASLGSLINNASLMNLIRQQATANGIEFPTDLTLSPDISTGVAASHRLRFYKPRYTQDPRFEGERGWRLQFARSTNTIFSSTSFGAGAPVTLGLGLSGNLGVDYSRTKVHHEKIDADDITYLLKRLNRFHRNKGLHQQSSKQGNKYWDEFYAEHRQKIQEILSNLANQNHRTAQDIRYFMQRFQFTQLEHDFFQAMLAYKNQKTNENEQKAKQQLEKFIEHFSPLWMIYHQSKWELQDYQAKSNATLSWQSKLAQKLRFSRS